MRSSEHDLAEPDYLRRIRAVAEKGSIDRPTPTGILLFGTDHAVRKHFPCCRIEYIRIPSTDYAQDAGQNCLHRIMRFEGPILRIVEQSVTALLEDLPVSPQFSSTSIARSDSDSVRYQIAKELVVNAVCHRSYHDSGAIAIHRYTNRIMIQNPGDSLIPVEEFGKHVSRCRNDRIAAALRELRWADSRGSGIGFLRSKLQQQGFVAPVFDSDPNAGVFRAFLLLSPMLTDKLTDLSEIEQLLMFLAGEIQALNWSMIMSIDGVSLDTAQKAVRNLKGRGLLIEKSRGKDVYFVPRPTSVAQTQSTSTIDRSDTLTELPEELQREIRNTDLTQIEPVMRLIVLLCSWKALSPTALGIYLGLSSSSLRENHIASLLEKDFLRVLENPNGVGSVRYSASSRGKTGYPYPLG